MTAKEPWTEKDKVEIELVGDNASFDDSGVSVDGAAKDLQRQLDETRERLRVAEEVASRAGNDTVNLQRQNQQVNLAMVTRNVESTAAALTDTQAQLVTAFESGDYAKAAELQVKIGGLTASLMKWNDNKAQIESIMRNPIQPTVQTPRVQGSNFEAKLAAGNFSPAAAAWFRANPEALTDEKKHKMVLSKHYELESRGVQVESPEYFRSIEQAINSGSNNNRRQDVNYSASPNAGGARQPGGNITGNKIYITSKMREAAEMSGIPIEVWAKNYKEAVESGEIKPIS